MFVQIPCDFQRFPSNPYHLKWPLNARLRVVVTVRSLSLIFFRFPEEVVRWPCKCFQRALTGLSAVYNVEDIIQIFYEANNRETSNWKRCLGALFCVENLEMTISMAEENDSAVGKGLATFWRLLYTCSLYSLSYKIIYPGTQFLSNNYSYCTLH